MVVTYEEVKRIFDYDKCEPNVKVALAIFYYPQKSIGELRQKVPEIPGQDITSIVNELVRNRVLNVMPGQEGAKSEQTYSLAKYYRKNLEEQLFLTLNLTGR